MIRQNLGHSNLHWFDRISTWYSYYLSQFEYQIKCFIIVKRRRRIVIRMLLKRGVQPTLLCSETYISLLQNGKLCFVFVRNLRILTVNSTWPDAKCYIKWLGDTILIRNRLLSVIGPIFVQNRKKKWFCFEFPFFRPNWTKLVAK